VRLGQPDWYENSHSLAFELTHPNVQEHLYVELKTFWEPLEFELPQLQAGRNWVRMVDTPKHYPQKGVIMMETTTRNSSPLNPLIGGAAIFILIYGMKLSATFLSPMLLAAIIGISVAPMARWMVRKGVPDILAILITIVVVILGIGGVILLMVISVSELVDSLPQYQDNLQAQINSLETTLERVGVDSSQISSSLGLSDPGRILSLVGAMFGGVFGVLSSLVVMLMVLIFMLLGAPGMSTKLKVGYLAESPTLARFRKLARDLRQYVNITTWINFLVGVVNTIFLIVLGVDYAVLWGLLSFLTGYIPNVGFWIALIPPFILALLEFGAGKALIVLVGFVLINGVVQNFLQPRMMGAGLNLSSLVVIVSLFFWGWVLGPMGALLAVPMTMIVKEIFLDAYEETRGLSDLMSADDPKKKHGKDNPAN
jgi:predicted PurR-regulated permease PerM